MMQASERGGEVWRVWFAIDFGCVVYFVIEQLLKWRLHGWRDYWASNWNRFDLAIVIVGLPVLLSPFFPGLETDHIAGLLILRLGRLFRLFRLLRFVPDRDRVGAGISRALRASMGVFLAVVLVNFILAMGGSMLFGELAPQYFGHPLKSFYSMFQVFTIEGWNEIPETIALAAQHAGRSEIWGVLARIYFLGSVLIGGILGLSLANAVFVDQMTADNTNTLENQVANLSDQVEELKRELQAIGAHLRE
jgi:voltage-gated sodium channel